MSQIRTIDNDGVVIKGASGADDLIAIRKDGYVESINPTILDAGVRGGTSRFYIEEASGDFVVVTNGVERGRISENGTASGIFSQVMSLLKWNGSTDYIPAASKALSTAKMFVGPTDPSGVAGVSLNQYDTWVKTS